jgi:hypothetical protein
MKNQYLKRKLLKEYINIKLREEKEILEEGLMDELKFGIGAFFLSQLGGIGVAGAVSPNQMAKELASNMPGVENVEYKKSNKGFDEIVFTTNTGEEKTIFLNNKETKRLKDLSTKDLKRVIKKSIDNTGDPEGSIANFAAAAANLEDAAENLNSHSDTSYTEQFKEECMEILENNSNQVEYILLRTILNSSEFIPTKNKKIIKIFRDRSSGDSDYDERDLLIKKLGKEFGNDIGDEDIPETAVQILNVTVNPEIFIKNYIECIKKYINNKERQNAHGKNVLMFHVAFAHGEFNNSDELFESMINKK